MSLQICGWNQTIFLSWWKLTEIITLLFKTLAELQFSANKNQLKIIRKVISVQWRFPIASTLTEQLIHRSLLFWQLILRYRIQGNIRPFIFIFSFSSDLQSIMGGLAGFIFYFFKYIYQYFTVHVHEIISALLKQTWVHQPIWILLILFYYNWTVNPWRHLYPYDKQHGCLESNDNPRLKQPLLLCFNIFVYWVQFIFPEFFFPHGLKKIKYIGAGHFQRGWESKN